MYKMVTPDVEKAIDYLCKKMKQNKKKNVPIDPLSRSGPTYSLFKRFIKTGWKISFIDKQLKYLTDKMLSKVRIRNDKLILGFTKIWYNKYKYDKTIKKTLMNMGLRKCAAEKADWAISPMIDTCYTDSQLIDISIEYLLGYMKPMCGPDVTHPFHPEIVNEWFTLGDIKIMNV